MVAAFEESVLRDFSSEDPDCFGIASLFFPGFGGNFSELDVEVLAFGVGVVRGLAVRFGRAVGAGVNNAAVVVLLDVVLLDDVDVLATVVRRVAFLVVVLDFNCFFGNFNTVEELERLEGVGDKLK